MFDIFTLWFLLKYFTRPMHFFGKWGLISGGVGGGLLAWLAAWKLWTGADIIAEHGPLIIVGALALVTGVILFCTGPAGRSSDAHVFREPGTPHLRRARNPHPARGEGRRRFALVALRRSVRQLVRED